MVGRLLVGVSDRNEPGVIQCAAQELHADREVARREPGGNADGRQAAVRRDRRVHLLVEHLAREGRRRRERVEDINPFVERFALEFTRSNEIRYRGFMPDAIRVMKQYDWPGNVRELKNFVEKIMVLEKGERITADMVNRELTDVINDPFIENDRLPIPINKTSEQAEIDIILRQLFSLKQDTELIRAILSSDNENSFLNVKPILPSEDIRIIPPMADTNMEVTEDGQPLIRDDAIGEILMKDLEKEAIIRTLRFFNNNRRKTARSLGVSERTLYRKIEDYKLEPKIKRS